MFVGKFGGTVNSQDLSRVQSMTWLHNSTETDSAISSLLACVQLLCLRKLLSNVFDDATERKAIQGTSAAHRAKGNKALADLIHVFSEHLLKTVREKPNTGPTQRPHRPGGSPPTDDSE